MAGVEGQGMVLDSEQVVVVAAGSAWPFYELTGGYVCQTGRTFGDAGRMAFYSKRQIHGAVPRILRVLPAVEMTPSSAARLSLSVDPTERRIGDVVAAAIGDESWSDVVAEVVLLTTARSPDTLNIPPVRHHGDRAWTERQRYVRLGLLVASTSTADLDVDSAAAGEERE